MSFAEETHGDVFRKIKRIKDASHYNYNENV